MTTTNIKRIESILPDEDYPEDEDKTAAVSELLVDIMHYCNEHQFNFWELEDKGHNWYKKEMM